ncbi:sulfatase [Lentisphaera profundi]|uniref:Sulfatase n=1 Tax=Lentisphaera profundi TaxID=1658616 RepID=A0ABY7VZ69_9BACT|nr:sulfatase [Lentisphaera profundi]WDE99007.1 sulfatase [Lentisphaera profundi]
MNLSPKILGSALLMMTCLIAKAAERPNVVFILTDDQRGDAVGYHKNPLLGIKTPSINKIAAEGVRFENMYCTTSLCSPSRAAFLSGTYTHTHKVYDNFTDYPHDLKSFPLLLQNEGYTTGYIGKWHMGENDDSKRPGFDYWVTHKGQGKYWDTTFNVNGERKTMAGYYAHQVTDMAIDFLDDVDKSKPFALILGHKAPHGPFIPEPKYENIYNHIPVPYPDSSWNLGDKPKWIVDRLQTWHGIYGPLYGFRKDSPDDKASAIVDFEKFVRSYTATVNSVDDSVGRVYDHLEKLGVLDNTILIYSSDNGFLLGEHGMIDKRTMHEASISVPLTVRFPKKIKAGTLIKEQVLSIDLAPTIMELTLGKKMPSAQGLSWAPLLDDSKETEWRKTWLYEYNYEIQFPYTPNVRGIRHGKWKYVAYPHGDGGKLRHMEELYNMERDPAESRNLAKDPQYASIKKKLVAELAKTLKATGAKPDKMPLDMGIKSELPEESIR